MRDFQTNGRSTVYATNGMVATSHPLAAQAALDILKNGGNAVDAAISGAVLLGMCEPQMTGIGGDLFALVHPGPGKEIVALNGSGRAAAAASADALRNAGHTKVDPNSVHAVTIPGAVDAFCKLSADYGQKGIDVSLAPAISYAKSGVPVAPRVAFDWAEATTSLQGSARNFFLKNGQTPNIGDMFSAPAQAQVLEEIAKNGRDGFYKGDVAQDMVASLTNAGGCQTLDDFEKTSSEYSDPISGQYKGHTLLEHAPNGQGATAILMLNMLAKFDIAGMDPWGVERAHIEAEIAKLAYDARDRILADPDHTKRLAHMLDPKTADALAALVNPNRAMDNPKAVSEEVHKETVYITVVDKDRMAVSLIYSIFHSFGSGIASDKYGILFQNRGAGFSLKAGHPNELGPSKRPMHTIIPAMLLDEKGLCTSFGVMGGAYQPNGHARFISNHLDFGLEFQSCIDAPRSFSDNGLFKVERGYSDSVRQGLSDLGHNVQIPAGPIGGAQSITCLETGVLSGASDPRKDGCALGY